jgi:hypothetical protein
MALFSRSKQHATPAFAHEPLQAAAGSAASGLGQFWSYTVGAASELALSVPTVSRATQMIISLVGSLPLRHYTRQWTGEKYEKIYEPTESWMDTPDPTLTRNFIMSNTCMDLMMRGRAFWYVTSRSLPQAVRCHSNGCQPKWLTLWISPAHSSSAKAMTSHSTASTSQPMMSSNSCHQFKASSGQVAES